MDQVSAQEALWPIVRPADGLKADKRPDEEECCQASQELARQHMLLQSFGQIVRKHEGHRFEDCKQQVAACGLSEVQRFAAGKAQNKRADSPHLRKTLTILADFEG